MKYATKAMLERTLQSLQDLQPWADYELDWAYGQPRLGCRNGSRDVFPRGTKSQVNSYMWMMIKSALMAEAHNGDVYQDLIEAARCVVNNGFEVSDEYGKQHWAISETQRNNVRAAIDKATD